MTNSIGDLISGLAAAIEQGEKDFDFDPEFPQEISGIKQPTRTAIRNSSAHCGAWVSVRLASKTDPKTYLGVYIGDISQEISVLLERETQKLFVDYSAHNPAIFVPDLNRLVWGAESWWGVIDSPEKLREITSDDIENIWYVQALKALEKQSSEETT